MKNRENSQKNLATRGCGLMQLKKLNKSSALKQLIRIQKDSAEMVFE